MKSSKIIILFLFYCFSNSLFAQMTNEKMDEIIRKEATEVEGRLGNWNFTYGEIPVIIITDTNANRMRIFSPVVEQKNATKKDMQKMLEANFHSALDAKYCLYEGFVISIFNHPLKELTDEQFIDAMRQVVVLAHTYGTTFSSTDMIFGGGFQEKEQPKVNQSPDGVKKS